MSCTWRWWCPYSKSRRPARSRLCFFKNVRHERHDFANVEHMMAGDPRQHHSHGDPRSDAPAHDGHVAHLSPETDSGHDKYAGHSVEMFRRKFWGTLLLSIPTVGWAPMIHPGSGTRQWEP